MPQTSVTDSLRTKRQEKSFGGLASERARRTRRRWRCSTAEKHHVSRGVVPTKVLRITNNAHHPSNNNNRRVGITTMASKVSLVTCLLVQVMEAGCSNFSGFRRRCSCSVLRRTTRLRLLYECPPHLLLLVSSLLDFFLFRRNRRPLRTRPTSPSRTKPKPPPPSPRTKEETTKRRPTTPKLRTPQRNPPLPPRRNQQRPKATEMSQPKGWILRLPRVLLLPPKRKDRKHAESACMWEIWPGK